MSFGDHKLKDDLNEIIEIVIQREDQLFKVLDVLSKLQSREATLEMIDNSLNDTVAKTEPIRSSKEDKIVNRYSKYSATKLEDQR